MNGDLDLTCPGPNKNKRPRRITDEMALAAAFEVAADLIKLDPDLGPAGEIADDIVNVTKHDRHMDGFQIGYELKYRLYWEVDMPIAEVLDGFSAECSLLLTKAEIQWGQENPMTPPWPDGTTVKTPHGVGVIEQVYDHAIYRYLVLVDGKSLIIPFEDTEKVDG